ncbi:disease resistance protein RUN1-like [Diospyros lotus]|uniref:disease resistance protein RUN1-like n=1 Tax=Diospyros lotus TaxID=55363 RepID=UPI002251E439|nr:disease resistance protein RUN1-like [Diospyros lotus]
MAAKCTVQACSSSYPSSPHHKYDVFLSFSGVDTRKKFTSHLLVALERNGLQTFRDDKRLDRGEDIGSALFEAIEDSRISLVVFSKSYFTSRWCLNELEKIMECKKKLQHIVLPIFYEVEPSDLRVQKGIIAGALASHKEIDSKMQNWIAALTEAASLSGWVKTNMGERDEADLIENIVAEVANKLSPVHLNVADYPVGIMSRLRKLTTLLHLESSNNICIVAIWGIGGIGKTTIAKAAYNSFHRQFEGSSFVADVRENSMQINGLILLQQQILCDILKNGSCNIGNSHEGIELIKRRAFCGRKVLLVLDDVDHIQQLKALAINPKFFHRGSRIIITTRNISSLNSLRSIGEVYTLEELDKYESLQLFSWHAFKDHRPMEKYMDLSNEIVEYAKGIPLTLEVLGCFLFGKTKSEWRSAMEKIKKIPHEDVMGKLKISFDSLNKEDKDLFLDIACYFAGMSENFTIQVLQACNFFPKIGIRCLADHYLIKLKLGFEFAHESQFKHQIVMHDLLRDMGREIVRRESFNYPGKRSRLWDHEDALEVLRYDKGTEVVEGLILLSLDRNGIKVTAKAFQKMSRLRILVKLKFLYLSHCYYLTATPDFSGLSNLEELFLDNCIRLVEVDGSIRYLQKLLVLDLASCKRLRKLPPGPWMLNPKILNLSGCSKLEAFAKFQGATSKSGYSLLSSWALRTKSVDSIVLSLNSVQGLRCLKLLRMENCSLSNIPTEIGTLIQLECLDLVGNKFSSLPDSMSNLTNLVHLNLNYCTRLQSLPKLSASLLFVEVQNCPSLESVSLESDWQHTDMLFYNCPQLDENYFANELARNLLHVSGSGTLSISISGDKFIDWLPYQTTGSSMSFVVPSRANQSLVGWVFCLVYKAEADFWRFCIEIHNKTKGNRINHEREDSIHPKSLGRGPFRDGTVLGYNMSFCREHTDQMQGGDEVEISVVSYNLSLKQWGIHPIYQNIEY